MEGRKNTGPSKNGSVKLIQLHVHQGSPLIPIFRALSPSLHRHSSVDQSPLHNPSSLTSVYLVPDLRLLPPSTPCRPYGRHPFFPHAQNILILSDMLYLLTPYLFQLFYAPLHSQLYPFVTLQQNFSNTSFQEDYFLSLSTSHTECPSSVQCRWNNYSFI